MTIKQKLLLDQHLRSSRLDVTGKISLKIDKSGVFNYEASDGDQLQYTVYNKEDYVRMIKKLKTKDLNASLGRVQGWTARLADSQIN